VAFDPSATLTLGSANESTQIRNEVVQGVNKGVPLVPMRIENVEPTKSLAYFMGAVHWLDVTTPPRSC
jgi:hypothetical protein